MFLRHLYEAKESTAVISFGRMNPPTIGHQKLVNKIKSIPGDHFLFLSQTQHPESDPLSFNTKVMFAQQFFPDINVGDSNVRTIIQALQKIETLGYNNLVYIAGDDRVDSFSKIIYGYNGKEYNFKNINIVNAGERDADSNTASGMSASKMRNLAASGSFKEFAQGVPDTRLAKKLYQAVRQGMGVTDMSTEDFNENDEFDKQVTPEQIQQLEHYLDKLYAALGIDITFTSHFKDRIKDPRNKTPITINDLVHLFTGTYKKYGQEIRQMGNNAQAVLRDMTNDVNVPFVLAFNQRKKEIELVAKTVMRKKNFATSNPILAVETSYPGNLGFLELYRFYKTAPTELVTKVKAMIANNQVKEVWKIVQEYTGTQLQGDQFRD